MPRLSIIIPVLERASGWEESLVSVLQHRPLDSELVIVLRGRYDDPFDLRDEEVRFVDAGEQADWLASVNRGLAVAAGEIVHLLAGHTIVEEQWAEQALAHFDRPEVGAVAPLVIDAAAPQRVLTAGRDWQPSGKSTHLWRGKKLARLGTQAPATVAPSTVAAFYRAEALLACGGLLDAALGPELAEVDLGLRLQAAGYQTVFDSSVVVTAPPTTLAFKLSSGAKSRAAEHLFWRQRTLDRSSTALGSHALAVGWELFAGLLTGEFKERFRGRCSGWSAARAQRIAARSSTKRPAHRPETLPEESPQPQSISLQAAAAAKKKAAKRAPLRRSA